MSSDPLSLGRVPRIGRRLACVCDRLALPFELRVVRASDIAAFALSGGFVYVFPGPLQGVPTEDALALTLAHEITHEGRRGDDCRPSRQVRVRPCRAPRGR